jgi:hypothetical protein
LAILGQNGQKGSKMTKNGHFWTPKRPPRFYTNLPALANSTEDFVFGKIRHKMPNFRGEKCQIPEKSGQKMQWTTYFGIKMAISSTLFYSLFHEYS